MGQRRGARRMKRDHRSFFSGVLMGGALAMAFAAATHAIAAAIEARHGASCIASIPPLREAPGTGLKGFLHP